MQDKMQDKMPDKLKEFMLSVEASPLPLPKLSTLLYPEKVARAPIIEEIDSDRVIITPQTKPGWYRLNNGEQVYVNDYDIPGRPPINAGSLRGTVEIRQPKLRWVVIPPSSSPSEPVRTTYSGTNRQLKETAKSPRWEEMINPNEVIVRK